MRHRIGHGITQRTCAHTCTKKKCKNTVDTNTWKHSLKHTLLYILKISIACPERFFLYIIFCPCLGIYNSGTGKQGSYNRIGTEPGLWALVIEILSSTDESSSGGGGWETSLPALNSSKLFWFAFQRRQVSGGRFPSLWALALHISLWPNKLSVFF